MNISWKQYQMNTKDVKPRTILVKALKELKGFTGGAIDLGCGSGNDTIYLVKKGWYVFAIDKEAYGFQNIKKKLGNKISSLTTLESSFEDIKSLPIVDLIVANNSLPFCNPKEFDGLWETIGKSIKKDGMFVGNFFGPNDSWKDDIHTISKKELTVIFKDYKVLYFKEIEKNERTGFGDMRHWHVYEIIAIKK